MNTSNATHMKVCMEKIQIMLSPAPVALLCTIHILNDDDIMPAMKEIRTNVYSGNRDHEFRILDNFDIFIYNTNNAILQIKLWTPNLLKKKSYLCEVSIPMINILHDMQVQANVKSPRHEESNAEDIFILSNWFSLTVENNNKLSDIEIHSNESIEEKPIAGKIKLSFGF